MAIGSNAAGAARPAKAAGTIVAGAVMGTSAGSATVEVGMVIGLAEGAGVGYLTTKTVQGGGEAMTDLLSRLVEMDCVTYQFDVAEMIDTTSLWVFPNGWRPLAEVGVTLPGTVTVLSDTATIFVSDMAVDGFAPTAVALGFQIAGNTNLDRLFIGLVDRTPEGATNHRTDSRVVVQESEYICAQMKSQFTAVCNEEIVDFESVTVFDLYINPEGLDVLLQRTVVASRSSNAPLPRFNQARPR